MGWGTVNVSDVTDESTTKKRFDEFMKAVMHGNVVPLLGAGASSDSVKTTKELLGLLFNKVPKRFRREKPVTGDFNRLAEIIHWHKRADGLCETLGIAEWAEAPPTRAHRYIALLACDGLITEVITTNYDCGLEHAYRAARGLAADEWYAIACEDDLRQARHKDGIELLRLYKINGCAERLARAPDRKKKQRAEEVLLTDRQLQKFGERRWAGDVFRVVLRSRQLVLSGFGSEEPQIWHVVSDILREFASKAPDPKGRFLWIAVYDGEITFPILQALIVENQMRSRKKYKFDSTFHPSDQSFFSGKGNLDKLDAGDFWRKVWIETLQRRLADPSGPVGRAFFIRVSGGSYRSGRYDDKLWRALWEKIVSDAFEKEGNGWWLAEPVREGTKTSQWAKTETEKPLVTTKCAPGLTCVRMPGGGARYFSPSEDPDYWVALLLVIYACPKDGMDSIAAILDPVISLRRGRSRLVVGRPSLGTFTTSTRRKKDGMIIRDIIAPVLRDLGHQADSIRPDGSIIATFVRDRLLDSLHSARQIEASQRKDIRRRIM